MPMKGEDAEVRRDSPKKGTAEKGCQTGRDYLNSLLGCVSENDLQILGID